jgi:hypothetical protein
MKSIVLEDILGNLVELMDSMDIGYASLTFNNCGQLSGHSLNITVMSQNSDEKQEPFASTQWLIENELIPGEMGDAN